MCDCKKALEDGLTSLVTNQYVVRIPTEGPEDLLGPITTCFHCNKVLQGGDFS